MNNLYNCTPSSQEVEIKCKNGLSYNHHDVSHVRWYLNRCTRAFADRIAEIPLTRCLVYVKGGM